ncbi:unnamed protein product [Cochlearia groenlandica]
MGRTFSYFRHTEDPSMFGHIKKCLCDSDAIVEASSTSTNPGRLFYTCPSRDDGNCHMCKWWDEAMMEELTCIKREVAIQSELKEQIDELASLKDLIHKSNNHVAELKNMTQKLSIALITLVVVLVGMYLLK